MDKFDWKWEGTALRNLLHTSLQLLFSVSIKEEGYCNKNMSNYQIPNKEKMEWYGMKGKEIATPKNYCS